MARLRLFALLLLAALCPAQGPLLSYGRAADVGIDADALAAAAGAVGDVVVADDVRGAVVLVARGRTVVLHEAFGWRDPDGERPMRKDSLFRMASNTKAVTAAAVLALVDRGDFGLDDPIGDWFPTFDHGHSSEITVRHLLTHTSGLRIPTLFLQPLLEPSEKHPDAPNLVLEVARFGEVGATVRPNTSYAYNNPGYNTLAALVEVVSGEGFEEFCRARFYEPLGMKDTCNHESRADHTRMSAIFRAKKDGTWQLGWRPGDVADLPFVRGSGGMISTAFDYALFCRMVLDGGVCGAQRLLSEKAVAAATHSQTEHIEGASYGLGWAIGEDGSFSHGGSDGTWAWCDPSLDLIGIVFTQTQDRDAVDPMRREFRASVTAACSR